MKKLQWNLLRNTEQVGTIHQGRTPSKEYERTLYACEADDLWLTIERPTETPSATGR